MSGAFIDTLISVFISSILIGMTGVVIVGAVNLIYGCITDLMDNISERKKRDEDRYE